MKKFIFPFVLLALSLLVFSMKPSKKKEDQNFTLEGTITEVLEYCGGAAPPDELAFPKPSPKAGIKLFVRKGNFNNPGEKIIDSLISDAEGKFKITLPEGTYTFIESWKKEKYQTPVNKSWYVYDTACYRKRYHEPDFTVEVKGNIKNIKINFVRYCSWSTPCIEYDGPLPPASNSGGGKRGE